MLDEYKKRAGSVFGVFGESPNEPKSCELSSLLTVKTLTGMTTDVYQSRIEANKERTTNAAGSHFLPGLKKGLYLIVRGNLVVGLPALFFSPRSGKFWAFFARFVGFRRVAAKSASKKLSPSTTTGPETPV